MTSESFFIWKKLSCWAFFANSTSNEVPLGSKTDYFFMKFWLQSVLKIFLKVVGSYVRCLRGTRRPGLHNGLTFVVIRPQNPFLFGKNWATWHFLQNQTQNDLPLRSKYVSFFMNFWLQILLKCFLRVVGSYMGYLRGTQRPGLSNAPTLVVIRSQNPFLLGKN